MTIRPGWSKIASETSIIAAIQSLRTGVVDRGCISVVIAPLLTVKNDPMTESRVVEIVREAFSKLPAVRVKICCQPVSPDTIRRQFRSMRVKTRQH